jgi:hypothetical protein
MSSYRLLKVNKKRNFEGESPLPLGFNSHLATISMWVRLAPIVIVYSKFATEEIESTKNSLVC